MVQVRESDIRDFEPPAGGGVVIINPPYGERMDKDDLTQLYAAIGDSFKKRFAGYDCWLITSNKEALKHVGLRPSRKIPVINGPLECRLLRFRVEPAFFVDREAADRRTRAFAMERAVAAGAESFVNRL